MAMSDEVRRGVVQANMTGPVTRGAWGILALEVLIFACIAGNFMHSGLIGCVIFFGFLFFLQPYPFFTLTAISLAMAVGAFWAHLHGVGQAINGIPLWLDSIGASVVIFIITIIINGILFMFFSDLF